MGFPVFDLIGKAIDKIVPDAAQRDALKLKTLEMEQNGELEDLKIRMSAILAEAQSTDKWTSRARPSFMYVMYIMILWALPMSIITAIHPATARTMAEGMQSWLNAIPTNLYELFGVVALGYVGGRTYEKVQTIKAGKS